MIDSSQHRTWSCKPRLVGKNRYNGSRREDDEPNEGSGQTNAGIRLECLIRAKYFVFLQHVLLEMLQGVPATTHQEMGFMHDGAHFLIVEHSHLHGTFPRYRIGRSERVAWPFSMPLTSIPWISSSRAT
ncbi:hypothetical protein TNCV_3241981 [Trichonephila clavipes]|nr:hypothetical protein TNCV_3241981 [Trichonephila clavipes]